MECDEHSPYVKIVDNFTDFSLDFVLVDGILWAHCAFAALQKIRPGGILTIDNANRYFPSNSVSPGSRKPTQGPASEEQAIVTKRLEDWRCIWTTNGVTDTALYLKPCDPARNLQGALALCQPEEATLFEIDHPLVWNTAAAVQ